MKNVIALLFAFQWVTAVTAAVGTWDWTLVDADRGGREIAVTAHYPAAWAGAESDPLPGPYPTVVFGHGFVMAGSDYGSVIDAWVAQDFVVIAVNTEGGLAPDHEAFGLDLAYVAASAAADLTPLSGVLDDRVAVGGHSMGGGAAWLAAAVGGQADAVFGLAPAETNPSAIAAASSVQIPALVLSGTEDSVTPAADHHTPIYAGTASACKAFVTLDAGSHCGYADGGSLCDLGELLFSGMSRQRQQEITAQLVGAWLAHWLHGTPWSAFEQASAADFSIATECSVGVADVPVVGPVAHPIPCRDQTVVKGLTPGVSFEVVDLQGRSVATGLTADPLHLETVHWPVGWVVLCVADGTTVRLVKESE